MFWPGLASIMINDTTLMDAVTRLRQGDRATLAQAMTLIESSHPRHQELSARLLDAVMPFTGNALRLGITGTAGCRKKHVSGSLRRVVDSPELTRGRYCRRSPAAR
nr:arginine/ornithine transport system ATPase [Salmonella sp. NCTC 7297]